MFLHDEHFYKTFAPTLSQKEKEISFKNTQNKDHQHDETRPKVLRKKITKEEVL